MTMNEAKRTLLVYEEDKALVEDFMTYGNKVKFTYRSDVWIDDKMGLIIKDKEVNKYQPELLALKYGLPLSLIKNITKQKKHGLFYGKPYTVSEASRVVGKVFGIGRDVVYNILVSRGYGDKPVTVEVIDKLVEKGIISGSSNAPEVSLEPVKAKLSVIMNKEVKRRPKIYSVRANRELAMSSKSSIEHLSKKLDNAMLIESLDVYKQSNFREKGRLRDYAFAVADDVLKAYDKELYVNLDVEGLERFAQSLRK